MKIYIGECPICRQGLLLIVKQKGTEQFIVMCDECESQWMDPEAAILWFEPMSEELFDLVEVTKDEVLKSSWRKYINE